MRIVKRKVDLNRESAEITQFKQGDLTTLLISAYVDGVPLMLTDMSVLISIQLPNNTLFTQSDNITVHGNRCMIVLHSDAVSLAGDLSCEVRFQSSVDNSISSYLFSAHVMESITNNVETATADRIIRAFKNFTLAPFIDEDYRWNEYDPATGTFLPSHTSKGDPNLLTIGTVVRELLEPYAEITGDTPNQVLNLGLPRGMTAWEYAVSKGYQGSEEDFALECYLIAQSVEISTQKATGRFYISKPSGAE